MGYFVKKRIGGSEGLVLPTGTTLERPLTPITGAFRLNSDTGGVEYYDGTRFVEIAKAGRVNITYDVLAGNGTRVTWTLSKTPTTETDLLVFINGIYQDATTYSLSGADITFTSPVPNGLNAIVLHDMNSNYVTAGNEYDVPNL